MNLHIVFEPSRNPKYRHIKYVAVYDECYREVEMIQSPKDPRKFLPKEVGPEIPTDIFNGRTLPLQGGYSKKTKGKIDLGEVESLISKRSHSDIILTPSHPAFHSTLLMR